MARVSWVGVFLFIYFLSFLYFYVYIYYSHVVLYLGYDCNFAFYAFYNVPQGYIFVENSWTANYFKLKFWDF